MKILRPSTPTPKPGFSRYVMAFNFNNRRRQHQDSPPNTTCLLNESRATEETWVIISSPSDSSRAPVVCTDQPARDRGSLTGIRTKRVLKLTM